MQVLTLPLVTEGRALQTLLLEIAEDCARGRYPTAAQFGSQLRQIELQSTAPPRPSFGKHCPYYWSI